MSISLDEYRCRLINKILLAGSQEEVIRFSNTAIKELEHHKINEHVIARFVERMISDLNHFNPMNKDSGQWSNIKMARIHFNRIKQGIT